MVFLTGDTHGEFGRIEEFCAECGTSTDDVMVFLGDAGINFYRDKRDDELKEYLSELPVTLLCIQGNHEERPDEILGYEEMEWNGGIVLLQPDYPNILFAWDGEVYDFDGKKAIAVGGAYSVDKYYRLANGLPWFPTEQPDAVIKKRVERKLAHLGWRVDYVFSHTVPLHAVPRHTFLSNIDQSTVDYSTEEWLQEIEQKLDYECWFAGHYHVTETLDGSISSMRITRSWILKNKHKHRMGGILGENIWKACAFDRLTMCSDAVSLFFRQDTAESPCRYRNVCRL